MNDGPVQQMIEWIQSNETIVWWLLASSAATFFVSLILVPMLVVRIPSDYFTHKKRHPKRPEKYPPVIRIIALILKNLLGLVLVLAGVLMLVLPGQGLFTMVVGIMMMNFPGKYKLERWIVERGPVLRSINWLRRRAGHDPLNMNIDGSPSPSDR
ncbi:hypothetical protein BMS3Bbin11_01896 [bacterium BMS3Bbin11]|nr:hypothetical protein BMS3Abin11_00879 [bacterium BMS3Abin11]GBE46795.1 hypothetical protein BMS3Bbin11_01896 [bacterium BMS3Bbin11]GMT40609.1 MAG: hypothetical protein IEMM0001_1344 [bacterium]